MSQKLQDKAKEAYGRLQKNADSPVGLLKEVFMPGSNLDTVSLNAVVNETNPEGEKSHEIFNKGVKILSVKYGVYASAIAYGVYEISKNFIQ